MSHSQPSSPALGGRPSNHGTRGRSTGWLPNRASPAPAEITGCPACAGHDAGECDWTKHACVAFSAAAQLKTAPRLHWINEAIQPMACEQAAGLPDLL